MFYLQATLLGPESRGSWSAGEQFAVDGDWSFMYIHMQYLDLRRFGVGLVQSLIRNNEEFMLRLIVIAVLLGGGLLAQSPARTKTTHVLATLTVNPGVTREEIMKVMPQELTDTVQLHLDGHIVQWFGRADGKGVVFLVSSSSIDETKALLNELPLIKQKLASFEFLALGPLTPLRLLLVPSKP